MLMDPVELLIKLKTAPKILGPWSKCDPQLGEMLKRSMLHPEPKWMIPVFIQKCTGIEGYGVSFRMEEFKSGFKNIEEAKLYADSRLTEMNYVLANNAHLFTRNNGVWFCSNCEYILDSIADPYDDIPNFREKFGISVDCHITKLEKIVEELLDS